MPRFIPKFKFISTREERKSVFVNYLSLSSLQSINYILPIIVLPYLIRVLGPEKFGLIAFAQSLVQYFIILTDYGFNMSATRQVALHKGEPKELHHIFSSIMTVKLILTFLSFLILLIIINLIPRFRDDWLIYLLSFGVVLGNALFPGWLFQGKETTKYTAIINITFGLIYLLCIFKFVKNPNDFLVVPILNSACFIATGLIGLYTACKKFNISFLLHKPQTIARELKNGWAYFISVVSVNAYTTSRTFAVGLLTNNVFTGYYSIAEKIANCVQTYPQESFLQAVYPRLTKIFAENKEKAIKLMRRIQSSTAFGFLISIPIAFAIAPKITKIICGTPYPEVTLCLRLLLIPVFFVTANAFKIQFLLISGRQDIYSKIHIRAALFGLPLIFLFIGLFSYTGAAYATIIIEMGVFLFTAEKLNPLTKQFLKK